MSVLQVGINHGNEILMEVAISVYDMKCSGCESTIRKRLLLLDAVYDVQANFQNGLVLLNVTHKFKLDIAKQAIQSLGYTLLVDKE